MKNVTFIIGFVQFVMFIPYKRELSLYKYFPPNFNLFPNDHNMKTSRKILISIFVSVLVVTCSSSPSSSPLTIEKLLDEMCSVEQLAEWPQLPYQQLQTSSYDRRSQRAGEQDWFANRDGRGFIRTDTIEGRIEKVLFDEQHPGVITRIWNTTTISHGTLRFYFDGHTSPDWIIPAYDFAHFGLRAVGKGLLECHTNYKKGRRGGNTFFLPIPYARGCKVTFEEPIGKKKKSYPRYYQFNFRRYPEGTPIESFSVAVARRAAKKIEAVCRELNTPLKFKGNSLTKQATLTTGESLEITLPEGSRAVQALIVRIAGEGDYGDRMRRTILTASFDGTQTIWAPLADFSGAGLGAKEVHSRYLEADGQKQMISFWPMPYRTEAILQLKNIADTPSQVEVEIYTQPITFTERTLYFHTSWRQECGLPINPNKLECRDWDFATLRGRGIYRGDVLTLFNHSPKWYGEGDEKIYIDGERFPSHFGTGTEDYYNSSWAPVVPFHTAFGGAPRADLSSSAGYSSWLRTRALDAIPFTKSLDFDLELISWVSGTVDYASTVYWYGDLDAVAEGCSAEKEALRIMPEEPEDPTRYVIAEGALEFEEAELSDLSKGVKTAKQDMSAFMSGRWSRAKHLLCKGCHPDSRLKCSFSGVENGHYRVKLYATRAIDYGQISLMLNQGRAVHFDGYAKGVLNSGAIDLGEVKITDGRLTLDIKVLGKNSRATGYLIGLDCLVLEKL